MTISAVEAERTGQICLDYLDPQELRFSGSTENEAAHFYTPGLLIDDCTILPDVNAERARVGFIRVSMLVNGLGLGDPRKEYAIDLPPIHPLTIQSAYDPSVWEVQETTEGNALYVLNEQMTVAVYAAAESLPNYSLQHREGKWKWEAEAASVEGRRNHVPFENMQSRK